MRNDQGENADATLTNILRAMSGTLDPVPDQLTTTAVAAYSSRTIDKELASLTYDSLVDDAPATRVPGGGRHLSFVGRHLSVEVDVGNDGLAGHLVPPAAAVVDVRWPGGSTSVCADDLGDFSVPPIPPGPVSLCCQRRPSGETSPTVTDWVTL